MSDNGAIHKHLCGYKSCRGTTGRCPHALVNDQPVLWAIESLVQEVAQAGMTDEQNCDGTSRYPRLRVALAACPNACTEPQTKDVGIIAIKVPTGVGSECDGCGRCEMVCREDAITITNGRAQIVPERCVGCGQCISECPREAISSEPVRFRILVGGRMGRHPRWAELLCVADGPDVAEVIQGFLHEVHRRAGPGERTSNVVERIGAVRLREEMFADV